MTHREWAALLLYTVLGTCWCMLTVSNIRHEVRHWQRRAQYWFDVHTGTALGPAPDYPALTDAQATRIMSDLFPRPMGAPPRALDPMNRGREWRERRALSGQDHTTRHSVEATTDSEAAREILTFTIGGLETMEGE